MVKDLVADVRQMLHAPAFRIGALPLPEELISAIEKLATPPPVQPELQVTEDRERLRFLADLATGVWRLRHRMSEPGSDKPREQFRREYSHLESVWDVLVQAGLEIQDHTGRPFDPGLGLKVAARVPTAGITRERVQETVRPTIYYKNSHIQLGEVIIETPIGTGPDGRNA